MATWGWIVVGIACLVIVAAVAWAVAVRTRTASLRQRFGPEYDRTVAGADDRRQGEIDLRRREKERARLDIRPLPAADRTRYIEEWQNVQARFVDDPSSAVASADRLLVTVMEARGYPVRDFEDQAELVSVDHPNVIENYRVAHRVATRNESKEATTEELRDALLRYRSLFDELLHEGPADGSTAPEPARQTRETNAREANDFRAR